MKFQVLLIWHDQYHNRWWPGDTWSRGIRNRCINLVGLLWSVPRVVTVNPSYAETIIFWDSWNNTRRWWLLMPWVLMSPGHQQPWYWSYRINKLLSSIRNDFNCLCHISSEKNIVNANISFGILPIISAIPANSQRNKHVIIAPKRRFDVIITCLLRFVFAVIQHVLHSYCVILSREIDVLWWVLQSALIA